MRRRPAAIYPDPIRGGDDVLVLCSVYNPDDTPHVTNTRAMLENMLTPAMLAEKPLYGFEQARPPSPLLGPRHPRDIQALLCTHVRGWMMPRTVMACWLAAPQTRRGDCSQRASRHDPSPDPRRPRAQEYTMLEKGGNVHGWPMGGFPAPQGPFYCGVGSESVYGRPLAEAHMDACIRVRPSGSLCLHVPAVQGMMFASLTRRAACLAALRGSAVLH